MHTVRYSSTCICWSESDRSQLSLSSHAVLSRGTQQVMGGPYEASADGPWWGVSLDQIIDKSLALAARLWKTQYIVHLVKLVTLL